MRLKGLLRSLKWICLSLILLCLGGYFTFRGSLPLLDGEVASSDLKDRVIVTRDAEGFVTLHGKSREDIAFATGFAHAQDRFFQMDLLRRMSSGELSALLGEKLLKRDQQHRFHQFRKLAITVIDQLEPKEKKLLKAYTKGVNRGLSSLSVRPFEYLLLGQAPKPWKEEDTILVSITFFFQMQDGTGKNDWTRGVIEATLPKQVATFFLQNGSNWQAALDDSLQPILPIPEEKYFSYLKTYQHPAHLNFLACHHFKDTFSFAGSNQWAVAPAWTRQFRPLLSNDMHLRLSLPNAWYRTAFRYQDEQGHEHFVAGLTLPGTPVMVIGSNQKIAWGLTNAFVDATDLAILTLDEKDPGSYMTKEGPLPFEREIELIEIKGKEPYLLPITKTIFGPVIDKPYLGNKVALMWTAHNPQAFNLKLIELEEISLAKEALSLGPKIRIPNLNLMIVDSQGNIGWTVTGAIPKRVGFDGTIPVSFADGSKRWEGFLDEVPIILNPERGKLWTANHRNLGDPWDDVLGKTGQLNGIRGVIIRNELMKHHSATPEDMLALQMSINGSFFDRWQKLLLEIPTADPKIEEIQTLVLSWDGKASDSSAFYWIRLFREKVTDQILQHVLRPCFLAWEDFDPSSRDFEEPVFMIASNKPSYLVPKPFKTWDEAFLATLKLTLSEHADSLETYTWGKKNSIKLRHPLSSELSLFQFLIDIPETPSSGDYYTPKVIGERVGASQRMIVSPGYEEEGMMHMPGGQSGHPLSPYYQSGHENWLNGVYSPFLPGQPQHTLILSPQAL